ncbi:MAG: hypothetical protein JSS02_15505 [Planctomycetes bacterium]|nr:hypothetical protein [Planctomycetota bacterium]
MVQIVVWLNAIARTLGDALLAPLAYLPGWLSISLIAVVTGLVMLLIYKYTSHQQKILQVRRQIQAELLTLTLFRESLSVTWRAQVRLVVCAVRLFSLSLVPMAIMSVPVMLFLGQLSAWFAARPIAVGEESVVVMTLHENQASAATRPQLRESPGIETVVGPVRIRSQHQWVWRIRGTASGLQQLVFDVGQERLEKELAIGGGFLQTSPIRPAWTWTNVLLYPRERPFSGDSPVQSIEIEYPPRLSWNCGSGTWLWSWMIGSMVTALACRNWFNVKL